MKALLMLFALLISFNVQAEEISGTVSGKIGTVTGSATFLPGWKARNTSDNAGMISYNAEYADGIQRFVVVTPEFFEHGLMDYCQYVGGVTKAHNSTLSCWAYAYLHGLGDKRPPAESVQEVPTGKEDILRSIVRAKGMQRDIVVYLVNGGAFVLETETKVPGNPRFSRPFLSSFRFGSPKN